MKCKDIRRAVKLKKWTCCKTSAAKDLIYSRNNLAKKKDVAYVTNLDEYKSIGIHWIALYIKVLVAIYFDNFGSYQILCLTTKGCSLY